jgi:hypothetical protein
MIVHFWWFEWALSTIEKWTFFLYFFVVFYAILLFLIVTILFPDNIGDYAADKEAFHSQQKWFYGVLALIFLVDVVDTAIKGTDHFKSLGVEYPIRQAALFVLAIIAMFVGNKIYHAAFVLLGVLYQIGWIWRQFDLSI